MMQYLEESKRTPTEKLAQSYYEDWMTLFNSGNIAGTTAKYEPDASRMLSEEPATVGIPGKQSRFNSFIN